MNTTFASDKDILNESSRMIGLLQIGIRNVIDDITGGEVIINGYVHLTNGHISPLILNRSSAFRIMYMDEVGHLHIGNQVIGKPMLINSPESFKDGLLLSGNARRVVEYRFFNY